MNKKVKDPEYTLQDLRTRDQDKDLQRIRNKDNSTLVKLYKLFQKNQKIFTDQVSKQIGSGWIVDTTRIPLEPIKIPTSPKGSFKYANYPIPQYPYSYFDMDVPTANFKGTAEDWMFHNYFLDPRYPSTHGQIPNIVEDIQYLRNPGQKNEEGDFILTENRLVPTDWTPYKGQYDSTEKIVKLIQDNFPKPVQGRVPQLLELQETGVNRATLLDCYVRNMTEFLMGYFGDSRSNKDELGRLPTRDELFQFVRSIVELYIINHDYYFNVYRPYQDELKRTTKLIEKQGLDIPLPVLSAIVIPDHLRPIEAFLKSKEFRLKYPEVSILFNYGPQMDTFDNPEKAMEDMSIYPREGGRAYVPKAPLLHFLEMFNRRYIVSPFGTYYHTTTEKRSFISGMIDIKKKERSTEKKAMLQAKKEGNATKAKFHNNNQGLIKINMNSMPGAMGSGYNFLSDRPNFNSVTSIARFFIMNAYAHAERFLESNFYFRNEEQLTNFVMTCKIYGPDPNQVENMVRQMGFKIPTWNEVYAFLKSQLDNYCTNQFQSYEYYYVQRLIAGMNTGQLCFLYYMSNMKHLVQENEQFFRPWIQEFLTCSKLDWNNLVPPETIRSLDGDLVIILTTIYNDWIPLNEKGNPISVYDCITEAPEIASKIATAGVYMQKLLDQIQPIFELFMNHKVGIGYVAEHRQMKREAVILSDTDSIIFTTKSWLQWYTDKLALNDTAFGLNALVVYWLTKANSYILYNISKAFGATGSGLKTMAMKNEFMMPVEILTTLKKHYAAIWKIQEGVVYAKPMLDIKGVGLRGSDFCQDTLNYAKWFIQDTIDQIYAHGKVHITEKLLQMARFERYIYDTLVNGSPTFLTVEPIRGEDEYKNAEIGIFFNYLFWEDVFAEKYGSIAIPTKCFILTLTNVRSMTFRNTLSEKYPDIYEKFMRFFEKYPQKELTRIPLNPLMDKIPDELRPVINYRSIIFANCRPMYIILQSLGYTFGNSKYVHLVSDICGWVTSEEAEKVKEHLV